MNRHIAIIVISMILLFTFSATSSVSASSPRVAQTCQPIYGGGASCVQADDFTVNKTVKHPLTNTYVDNINLNEKSFYAPGQQVSFKITVKNTTNTTVSSLMVKDVFPWFIEPQSGDGKYDTKTRIYSFTIDTLNKNESKEFFVVGTVVPAQMLPGVICVVNQTIVSANKNTSQDNAQVCLAKEAAGLSPLPRATKPQTTNPPTSKGGLPVYEPTQTRQTPATGPEALALIGLLPAGALGFWLRGRQTSLRKKSK